jgi:hypothetical protein
MDSVSRKLRCPALARTPMLALRPYVASDAGAWDSLVRRSRNGNLLHLRGYMDYHAHRFTDRSLVVERRGEVIAVFPASLHGDRIVSHGGLTYAGLIASSALRAQAALSVFESLGDHCRAQGVQSIVYKAVPHIFQTYPAEEDLYALYRMGARLIRRDIASAIALREALGFAPERRRSIQKARRAGFRLQTNAELADFHALLTDVLRKHDATPTHTLAELHLLRERFPDQIVLHEARNDEALLAGVLVYDFGTVVHTQYLAVSELGRQLDALSLLLADLIENRYADRRHFSFGISSEQEGRVLNSGLIEQKERFGARAIVHDFYEWVL